MSRLMSGSDGARTRAETVGHRSDSVDLAPSLGAVGLARLHVRRALHGWGLDELEEDAAQVVSEVTANAIEAHAREGLSEPVRLTLVAGLRTLLIVVRDASPSLPSSPSPAGCPGLDDESGRGLFLVDALAAAWDTKVLPSGGKAVRVLLRGSRQAR